MPDTRTEAILRIICENWDDERADGEWAERVHLSRYYFQRMFLHLIGETPGELRRRLKLERAAHALRPCADRFQALGARTSREGQDHHDYRRQKRTTHPGQLSVHGPAVRHAIAP